MPPAHLSSAERRARRARRKKLRRNGRRLITAGWVVVVIAVLVGIVGLRDAMDDGDDDGGSGGEVAAGNELGATSLTATTRRPRPSAVGATDETVVVDLIPTTTVPGAGGGPAATTPPADAGGATFGVRTPTGIVTVNAAPRALRPSPNARPNVLAPSSVTRDGNGDVTITGVTVIDPDYPGQGDIGVAIIGQGTITLTPNAEVQLLGRNGGAFVGLAGPPAAINRALASIQFHSEADDVDLVVTATDWAYGDLSRSQSGYATIRVR